MAFKKGEAHPRPKGKRPWRLVPRQAAFVREYPIDFNATQAAIRAGYSPASASTTGHELLKNPKIQALIQEYQKKKAEEAGITVSRVLGEIERLAFGSIRDFYDTNGKLLPIHRLPPAVAARISSVETTVVKKDNGEEETVTEYLVKIRQWDKLQALTLAGKHLNMWNEKADSDGTVKVIVQGGLPR